MRGLTLIALFVVGISVPAMAQQVTVTGTPAGGARQVALPGQPSARQASADVTVARMMSFDRNHDGLVSRDELPERMQPLLTRIEVFTTGDGLDETEIRRLASNPIAKPQVFVLQEGHYGFGEDNGFDTRLHIESAIEDLRLAGTAREKALEVGKRFEAVRQEEARNELMTAMKPILTEDQMVQFVNVVDRKSGVFLPNVEPIRTRLSTLLATAGPEGQGPSTRQIATLLIIASFELAAEPQRLAEAALDTFTAHERLSDADRSALLAEMRGLLSEQERDDLRAALERRPIVKQAAAGSGAFKRVEPASVVF